MDTDELSVGTVLEMQQGLNDLRRLTDDRSVKISGQMRYRIFLMINLTKAVVEAFEKSAGSLINEYAYEVFDISPTKVDADGKPVKVSTNRWQYKSAEEKKAHLEVLDKMRLEQSGVKFMFAFKLSELIDLNLSVDALISLRVVVEDDMAGKAEIK